MPYTFDLLSKDVVKKLQGKDLRPVKYLSDAAKFRQFDILQKTAQSLFWKSEDTPVGYSLLQILEPNFPIPEPEVSAPLSLKHMLSQKLKANADVKAIAEGSASTEFAQSCGYDIEVQKTSLPYSKLESLQNRKLLAQEPYFVKDYRMGRTNLYVVTEAYEVTKDTVLEDSSSVDLSGKALIPQYVKPYGQTSTTMGKHLELLTEMPSTRGRMSSQERLKCAQKRHAQQGQAQGQWQRKRTDSVTIHKGSVVAYKKKQLVIENNTCAILLSTHPKKKTFLGMLNMQPRCSFQYLSGVVTEPSPIMRQLDLCIDYISPIGRIEEPYHQDFKRLQDEVSLRAEQLSLLSKDARDVVFSSLLPLLSDREDLHDLINKLELNQMGHMDGPGGIILAELRKDSIPPWIDLKNLILYLLQALMVLSDSQLNLLAQSMEKRLLLQQQELVKSILQPHFKYPWCIPFTLQPQLLAPLQGEGLAITYELLKECGLQMEPDNPRSTWDLEAKMPLSALYGSLSLLQELVEA